MDYVTFSTLYSSMHRIIAKDMLRSLTTADYPNIKSEQKRKIHKEVYKAGYPESFENKAVKTTDLKLI